MILRNCLLLVTLFTLLLTSRAWGVVDRRVGEIRSVWTQDLPHESWMNVMLMGVKIGRFHVYADRAEYKGESVLRINSEMFAEINRFGLSMKTSKTKLCYLRDDLSPCYFMSRSDETGQEKIIEGTVENSVATIRTTLEGKTSSRERELPPDIIFAETLEEMAIRRGLKAGDEYSLTTFSLDFFDIINVRVKVGEKESIEYKGEMKEVFVVEYIMDVMGGITTRQWMSADGEAYMMEMPSMGMKLAKVSKEEAMGSVGQLDLLVKTRIYFEGERPKPGISEFKVKATLLEGDISATFVASRRQKVFVNEDPGQGIIQVDVEDVDEKAAPRRPVDLPELLPYLSPSTHIQSDDPDIIRTAHKIAGDEENAWKAAVKLCKWVNESIKDKNYRVGLGTAKQTLKDLQGDCSEHTVLFIGLARALGIPSRISTGLVYHKDAFYYHFWPEVYAGRWIAMEPTLGQSQADATHIQFISSPVETESALELGEGVVRTMNRLKIERISDF